MKKGIVILFFIIFYPTHLYAQQSYLHHNLIVKAYPKKHLLEVLDTITLPLMDGEKVYFRLNSNLAVTSNDKNIGIEKITEEKKRGKGDAKSSELTTSLYRISFFRGTNDLRKFSLSYTGKIFNPPLMQSYEYSRGFSETSGTISSDGIYLAGGTVWVPRFNDDLITFTMTAVMPSAWEVISQGKRTIHSISGEEKKIQWDSMKPMDEIFFIGGKFTEYKKTTKGIETMVFLRTPDPPLANKYIEVTSQYLSMYESLIGPFPYTKFALVENFWETGYGMPSFTLLGSKIIRFPFILHSSYPHELLHNWWGNGVFVDYSSGNWCEGLTAYLADHLIKQQRGLGVFYRKTTLQKYADYVNRNNDFPLSAFTSRTGSSTEAVGYGKTLMVWHMLRNMIGDDLFRLGLKKFYEENKFRRASFEDIQKTFEKVSNTQLKTFFEQWIYRTGAPALKLSSVTTKKRTDGYSLSFVITQTQREEPYDLLIPIAVYLKGGDKAIEKTIRMKTKKQAYEFVFSSQPVHIDIDPRFDLFRTLHQNETPPALSSMFGSEEIVLIYPSQANESLKKGYLNLAESWARDRNKAITIVSDKDIGSLPKKSAVVILGWENRYISTAVDQLLSYPQSLLGKKIQINNTTIKKSGNSFVLSFRNKKNPGQTIVLIATTKADALPGLGRKLPHYGKYSYLAFEGDEPANILKGRWPVIDSPLSITMRDSDGTKKIRVLSSKPPLITLPPVFSEERIKKHVEYLSHEKFKGRQIGTKELHSAAEYIASQFKRIGLIPGGDDGSYFQKWKDMAGKSGGEIFLENVIAVIPGADPKIKNQSVVISAHYDHIGLGWPDVKKGNEGKIHFGADDNASGVSVLLEVADVLKNTVPKRAIVFVAFTGEERGLLGSIYYRDNYKRYPPDESIGVVNLDTVGRLDGKKIMVLGGSSAKEWRHIFMGTGYVTGIQTELITLNLNASDQVSFNEKNIPAIQLTSGPHTDYHTPKDTSDKIDYNGLVKVATTVREVALYLSQRDALLTAANSAPSSGNTSKRGRKVKTGVMPDFTYKGKGVLILEISKGSPLYNAGLKKGDIIIGVDKEPVSNLVEYSQILKRFKPLDRAMIQYLRDGKKKSEEITFVAR